VINCLCSQCLSKLAFKRVRKAKGTFRALIEKVLPHRKKRLTQKYTKLGLFDFRQQTARVRCSSIITLISLANTTTYPVWQFISLAPRRSIHHPASRRGTLFNSRIAFSTEGPLVTSCSDESVAFCLPFPLLSLLTMSCRFRSSSLNLFYSKHAKLYCLDM